MTITTGYKHAENQELASSYDRRRMWKTSRKEILRPRQFEDGHLLNTINLLQRRHEELLEGDEWWTGGPENRWPIYPVLVREARRRGLMTEPKAVKVKRLRAKINRQQGLYKFDVTLHKDSSIPLRLNNEKLHGVDYVTFEFEGHRAVCLDKKETEELHTELTKILRGWW